MIANYTPAVECSMAPSLECYNQLAEKLNLGKSQKNYNIGVLDRICKTGQSGIWKKTAGSTIKTALSPWMNGSGCLMWGSRMAHC